MFTTRTGLDTKQDIYEYIRFPTAPIGTPGHADHIPAKSGGEIFSILEWNSSGIPSGHMACTTDSDRSSFGFIPRRDLTPFLFDVPFDGTISNAQQQLWHNNTKAVEDKMNAIIKVRSAENTILCDFRNFMHSNHVISSHIGKKIINNMNLNEMLLFIHNEILVFTAHDIKAYKAFMARPFMLDSISNVKPSLQLDIFNATSDRYERFAESKNYKFREEETQSNMRGNFSSDPNTKIFYDQQMIRNGLSTKSDIIASMNNGIVNLDMHDAWKTNKFVFNAMTDAINDSDSDDSTLQQNANAVIKSAADKKKKKKKKTAALTTQSSVLQADHPDTFCNFEGHNGKQQTHSNKACAGRMLIAFRQAHFKKHLDLDAKAELEIKRRVSELTAPATTKFPPPR